MNEELIDQIAFQAGCDKHWYNDPNNPDLCGRIISREVLDKFAELIIKECQMQTVITACSLELDANPFVDQITKHFGVE